jgi:hypothetical protein
MFWKVLGKFWGQACGYAFSLSLTLCNVFSPACGSPMLANRDKNVISHWHISVKNKAAFISVSVKSLKVVAAEG